jgi:FtsP/CotA-like multicopper oxidase with cupredoxin domain
MILHGAELHSVAEAPLASARSKRSSAALLASAAAVALLAAQPAAAQAPKQPTTTATPTSTNVGCPTTGQDLIKPPELVSSGGVLRGTIFLQEEPLRVATAASGTSTPAPETCAEQLARLFLIKDGNGNYVTAPKAKPESNLLDPFPGPTLRAKVGELVEVGFVNVVNPARFDSNFELNKCMEVTAGGTGPAPGLPDRVYPIWTQVKLQNGSTVWQPNDVHPNCLHASSTANIHYHGTHTNPNSFGDNVYLEIPPLPRDNQGNLTTTPAQAMAGFDKYFDDCTANLKPTPLKYWPATWADLPTPYLDKQKDLLGAYQNKYPVGDPRRQPLWDLDQQMIKEGTWPIYYIGAVPHCFALPAYTANQFPPPSEGPGSDSPKMGQSPGTHWYHAHKHGSTHINVLNGMSGAFIIEGKYDDDLNSVTTGYGSYVMKDNKPWNTRSQPVIVLNQLATDPNLLSNTHFQAGQSAGIDMSVNGRLRPKVQMQQGEVQLWRIVNSSPRNAVYFMGPPQKGFKWRQIAQDGVQFTDANYSASENKPFYMAPANRADLLVQAPMQEGSFEVRVQQVMGRSQAQPTAANPGTVLMTVEVVKGPPLQNGKPITAPMPFITAPTQPVFLTDITDDELKASNYIERKLVFHSGPPKTVHQHTINDIQFGEGDAMVKVVLGAVEEWTVQNTTQPKPLGPGSGIIDHPLHIHINPFQVWEFFDPNENMVDDKGQLRTGSDGKSPIPLYIVKSPTGPTNPIDGQCVLDPDDPATWIPCRSKYAAPVPKSVWWDVFAIPSGRAVTKKNGKADVIPGYYKMRSRFVDFKGLYVLHCHILVHEDRGMMYSVEVIKPDAVFVRHH